jgi:hypothetical protein
MATEKAPTNAEIASDIKWTREYIGYIRDAKKAGDFESASRWANEISAIWGTISYKFEEAGN